MTELLWKNSSVSKAHNPVPLVRTRSKWQWARSELKSWSKRVSVSRDEGGGEEVGETFIFPCM